MQMQPPTPERLPTIEETIKNYVNQLKGFELKFDSNVDPLNIETKEEVETIFNEVVLLTVQALLNTKGNNDIMDALRLEFVNPMMRKGQRPELMMNMLALIATKVAQKS
jgi:hypothetical protein